jgi:hypothetical protein
MVIWRIGKLVEQTRSRPLSSRELLPYTISIAMMVALAFVATDWLRPWDRDDFEAAVDSATTLLAGMISALGVWACYRANGKDAGVDFVDRLISIGFVLLVRFIVCCLAVFVVCVYAAVSFRFGFRPSFEDFDVLFVFVVALFWFRLHRHIKSVGHARAI